MLSKAEVLELTQAAGLDAKFRISCQDQWSSVVLKTSEVPTHYLKHLVDYQSTVFEYVSKSSIEISLVIFNDSKACAVWPLFLEVGREDPIKSINDNFGGVIVPPLFVDNFPKKSIRRIIKACIEFLNRLLVNSEGHVWRCSEPSTKICVSQWHQLCLENGAVLDKVNYELFVDLTLPIDEIRTFIRKSYKPLVSSGLKKWKVTVMDQYCERTWNDFRVLHGHVAGRVTRPIESWNIQHNAIKAGNAFLIYVSNPDGNMVGGGYFDMSANEGNYSVATYDKKFLHEPLGHLVQYQAILTLKEKGRSLYYIGSRFYSESPPCISKKLVDITSFKAGFATLMVPNVILSFSCSDQ